jgi:small subunit ribosomal protein S8
MLTRIRNANLAYKDDLLLPASKMNEALLRILDTEGFIGSFVADGEGIDRVFRVTLKYSAKRERTITGLKRISKPGRRIYARRGALPRVDRKSVV